MSTSVVIGRFQPLHSGHVKLLDRASEISDSLLVLVGSINQPRTIKNPFTFWERSQLIESVLKKPVTIRGVEDNFYNESQWLSSVQEHIATWATGKITIVGYKKDDSSYYLNSFPQFASELITSEDGLSAEHIRDTFFRNKDCYVSLPQETKSFLQQFAETSEYELLREEYWYIQRYKKSWDNAPYPPTFVTADAVVIKSGHVLLIRRKHAPGYGLYAIPGGFVNQNESVYKASLRECQEETGFSPTNKIGSHVFDYPGRSLRGRVITHAFLFNEGDGALPTLKPDSDASEAIWVPIFQVKQDLMFEDHYHILQYFLNAHRNNL